MQITRILAAIYALTLASAVGLAAPTHETTIEFEEALAVGAGVRIENLVGSIRIRGGDQNEGIRIEGQVLAEAKTLPLARELAEGIRFVATDDSDTRTIRVAFPTERHREFRVPAVGFGGMVGKWVTPLVRKSTVAVDYGGRQIQVGQQRGATAISVELTVYLPFDVDASFRQVVGSIDLNAARGTIDLNVIEGRIDAEQVFGSLTVGSGGGDVSIRRFQGEILDVHSGSGDVELLDVRVRDAGLTTDGGFVRAQNFETASLELRTGSGDVELAGFESESFTVESQSGSVAIGTSMRGLTHAAIDTSSGDVVVRVASDRGFDVAARTKSGDITAYRMELVTVVEDGRTVARRGRGGPALDIATPDGKLTVRPDDGSWSARLSRH